MRYRHYDSMLLDEIGEASDGKRAIGRVHAINYMCTL